MATRKPTKKARKGETKSRAAGNEKTEPVRSEDAQVFKFRVVSSLGANRDFGIRPQTGDEYRDRLVRLCWIFIQKFDSTRLPALLATVAHNGRPSPEEHQIEVDTNNPLQNALLEEIWSHLRECRSDYLHVVLPVLCEVGLEDAGEVVNGRPVKRGKPA